MSWTEQEVALLKKLCGDRLTALEISEQMPGKTRNAVIGKINRLRLCLADGRKRSGKRARANIVVETPAKKIDKKKIHERPDIVIAAAEIKDGQCRWPYGDPKQPDFGFCGGECLPRSNLCALHKPIVWQGGGKHV